MQRYFMKEDYQEKDCVWVTKRGQVRMDCSKRNGARWQSVYRLSCENFRCQMGPQKKSSQRKKITKNCHRSGGAIASAADTKCFFGGKNTRNHCAI